MAIELIRDTRDTLFFTLARVYCSSAASSTHFVLPRNVMFWTEPDLL